MHRLRKFVWIPVAALAALCALGLTQARAAEPARAGEGAPKPSWDRLLRMEPADLLSPVARGYATNILSHQTGHGDWPKNLDTFLASPTVPRERIEGTWDNRATVREIRWLANYHAATADAPAGEAVRRALEHILDAQYPNGGWPQRHPPGNGYHRHITFNDGTFINLLRLLDDANRGPAFRWLPEALGTRIQDSRARGLACLLRCQVRLRGQLTIWGAQHDAVTLAPASARTFEPASLAGAESAGVLLYLMELPNPGPEVSEAIESGARWFALHGIDGIRVVQTTDGDRRVEDSPGAPRLWARFYDLAEEQPLFCGRDGRPVRRLAEIERERRGGYAWYGTWGAEVARAYGRWKAPRK